jgi:hypothetical protein
MYRRNVIRALATGLYRPRDLLFVYDSTDRFAAEWWNSAAIRTLRTPGLPAREISSSLAS